MQWLEHHKGLGVGRVYVIDNLSDVRQSKHCVIQITPVMTSALAAVCTLTFAAMTVHPPMCHPYYSGKKQ